MTWPFGDACQGNTTIWMWLKSIISVWCFGRLGLQRRYRAFGPPSPKCYLRCNYCDYSVISPWTKLRGWHSWLHSYAKCSPFPSQQSNSGAWEVWEDIIWYVITSIVLFLMQLLIHAIASTDILSNRHWTPCNHPTVLWCNYSLVP